MTVTAQMVKELRESTGAGMMDAKKALVETNGDMEAAVDWLRTKGLAKAAVHMDCMHWVNRDSYLPQGSPGLKVCFFVRCVCVFVCFSRPLCHQQRPFTPTHKTNKHKTNKT